jgi:CMP-N,N'-diacetyllegionaminic acid synthase
VRCATESGIFDHIAVTSDSIDILEVAYPAWPILRPAELATDTADITDAVRHALNFFDFDFGMLALLQPTDPTRTPEVVRECVEAVQHPYDAAWTVSEVPPKYHEVTQLYLDHDALNGPGRKGRNRQSLTPRYITSGLCYAVTVSAFEEHGICGSRCKPIFTAPSPHIDTPEDLEEARRLLG